MPETPVIDPALFRQYLNDVIETFEAMDGHMDPATDGNARVKGALLALGQVQHALDSGEFTP